MIIMDQHHKIEMEKGREQIIGLLSTEVFNGSVNIMVNENKAVLTRNKEYFIGKVGNESFIVSRLYKTGRSVWSPIVIGTIETEVKTTIYLKFKAHFPLNIALLAFDAVIILSLIKAITQKNENIYLIGSLILVGLAFYILSQLNFNVQVKRIKVYLMNLFG